MPIPTLNVPGKMSDYANSGLRPGDSNTGRRSPSPYRGISEMEEELIQLQTPLPSPSLEVMCFRMF